MNLPSDFIKTIQNTFGDEGSAWLIHLPELVARASKQWGLKDIQPVSNLSYNFVAFAKQGEGGVVLKIGVPRAELISEMGALKLFGGNGACQLLNCDEERGFLLLERLNPGRMLSELEDDDERTHIAADVMQKLWRPVPESNVFIKLSDWFNGLKKIRPHFNGGTGPFRQRLLEQVESFLPELFAESDIRLIHGDFHHYNILSSDRGWMVIDPKGIVGPAGYEIGPLMINPCYETIDANRFKVRAERRVSILVEKLNWERSRIIQWSTAHAVLSAWWEIEDGADWEYSMRRAEIFSDLK